MNLERETEIKATKRMVVNPDTWPRWPLLPVKNRTRLDPLGLPTSGYLIEDTRYQKGELVVYAGNIFCPAVGSDPVIGLYLTADALVDAGWVVD